MKIDLVAKGGLLLVAFLSMHVAAHVHEGGGSRRSLGEDEEIHTEGFVFY
jgi:hypothetical protein